MSPTLRFTREPKPVEAVLFSAVLIVFTAFLVPAFDEDQTAVRAVGIISILLGLLLGLVIYTHPYRAYGVYPWAGLAMIVMAVARMCDWPTVLLAPSMGLVALALAVAQERYRVPIRHAVLAALIGVGLVAAYARIECERQGRMASVPAYVLVAATLYTLVAGWLFIRQALELMMQMMLLAMYRIRSEGPGLSNIPRGAVLVISNHAGMLDPPILEHVLPRPLTALMTANYYDLWPIRWLCRYVFRPIRVPEKTIKRELPEVAAAIAAIDAGQFVMIFPEGYLRRTEETPLRRFGQGVWQILRERPDTPVLPCWIEGTWGSFFSHRNGPPMKGKPFDFRRLVRVAVNSPQTVPAEILADGMATRLYLMNLVADARTLLNLPSIGPYLKDHAADAETDET